MPQPWTSSASASLEGGIVTLVEGSSFAISLPSGDMLPGHTHGVFFRDTRFLSEFRLRVNDEWPEPLAAQTLDPFSAAFVLRAAPPAGEARRGAMTRGGARDHPVDEHSQRVVGW